MKVRTIVFTITLSIMLSILTGRYTYYKRRTQIENVNGKIERRLSELLIQIMPKDANNINAQAGNELARQLCYHRSSEEFLEFLNSIDTSSLFQSEK